MPTHDLNTRLAVADEHPDGSLEDLTGELYLLDSPSAIADPQLPNPVVVHRDTNFRRLLGTCDILSAVIALVATATFTHTQQVYWSMFIAVLFVVPMGKLMGLYDRDANVMNHTTLDEVPKLFTLSMMTALVAFIARDLAVIGTPGIGSKQLVFLIGTLTATFCATRVLARFIARSMSPAERLLVVSSDADAEDFRHKVDLAPSVKATIIGRVPIAYDELPGGSTLVLGGAGDIRRIVDAYRIDRIVVIPGDSHADEVSDVIRAMKSIGVKISLVPQLFDAIGASAESDEIGGEHIVGARDFQMTASSALVKRTTDVVGATLLLLLSSPLMILAAIAIKIDSRGPVFFRQARVGRGGEEFEIFKFRTMRAGAENERIELADLNETSGLFKVAQDPRVTRVGSILRRTSIDELPQLFNVFRGEMSLVGPRPLVPIEDVAITGWYRRRSQITPGITGVWQLHGPVRAPLAEMVKLDYLYVANWSWWSDVKIMLRTAHHMVARRGL